MQRLQTNRKYKYWLNDILHVALILFLLTVSLPSDIFAQAESEPGSGEDSALEFKGNPTMDAVATYAQSLDISYEEAERRLDIQNKFGLLIGKLYEEQPTYGGGWIEHKPNFRLGIYFSTSSGDALLRKYMEEYNFVDQIQVMQSPYTLKELEALVDALFDNKELHDRFAPSIGIAHIGIGCATCERTASMSH